MTNIGHNSGGIAEQALRQYVDRIERLKEEIKGLNSDVSDVYQEAKSTGFNVKALKTLIAERARDPRELSEIEGLVDLYRLAVSGEIKDHSHAREETE